jgi:hypothetical protein
MTPSSILTPDCSEAFFLSASARAFPMKRFFGVTVVVIGASSEVVISGVNIVSLLSIKRGSTTLT